MALKQGVVDGHENPIGVIYSNKMYETQKYLSVLNYTYNSTHMVMNKEFLRRPPEPRDPEERAGGGAAKAGAYAMKTIRDPGGGPDRRAQEARHAGWPIPTTRGVQEKAAILPTVWYGT
jgi:hypothetical protein